MMTQRVRAHDWRTTPLGDVAAWPSELTAAIGFVLESPLPTALLWGAQAVTIPNTPFAAILGPAGHEQLGRRFDAFSSDGWTEIGSIVEKARRGAATLANDWSTMLNRQGWPERAWFMVGASPFRGSHGAVGGVVVTLVETTAAVQANGRAEVLAGELGHRLKNTMAMVHAMAQQSLRDVPDRAAVEAFKDRIVALGRAHDVLLQQDWKRASVASVAKTLTALHGREEAQFSAAGPDVMLGPRAVLSLSMLLHELATNASKYGALSVDRGRVAIGWRIDGAEEDATLIVDWRERGGPPPRPSGREGFGSRLIKLGLLGTRQVGVEYPSEGFQATFWAPLRQLERS